MADNGIFILSNAERQIYELAKSMSAQLANMFIEEWERIPFSFDLDRSSIFQPGHEFACLVQALTAARFMEGVSYEISGVYIGDFIAQSRARVEQPTIIFEGGPVVANISTFYVLDGAPIFLDVAVAEIVRHLGDLAAAVTQFRQRVEDRVSDMDKFPTVMEEPSFWLKWKSHRFRRTLGSMAGRNFYVNRHTSHLRMKLGTKTEINVAADTQCRTLSIDFCPAWGETADRWAQVGWRPSSWEPLHNQAGRVEGVRSSHLGVYWFNVLGTENPALERTLLRMKRIYNPAMFVLTSTDAPPSHLFRVKAILGYEGEGHRLNETSGGTWLVWDTSRIVVSFVREMDEGWEMVLTAKR